MSSPVTGFEIRSAERHILYHKASFYTVHLILSIPTASFAVSELFDFFNDSIIMLVVTTDSHSQETAVKQPSVNEVLENLMSISFAKAKFWSGGKWLIEISLYVGGVIAVFVPVVSHDYPPVALITALALAIVSARAEKLKGIGETLKREHEHTGRVSVGHPH